MRGLSETEKMFTFVIACAVAALLVAYAAPYMAGWGK